MMRNMRPFCTIKNCKKNETQSSNGTLSNYRILGQSKGIFTFLSCIFPTQNIFKKYLHLHDRHSSTGLSHTHNRRTIKGRTYSRVREGIFSLSRLDFILASHQFTTARQHRGVWPPASRHSSLRWLTKNNPFNRVSFTNYFGGFRGRFPWEKSDSKQKEKNGTVSESTEQALLFTLRGALERDYHKNEGETGHC